MFVFDSSTDLDIATYEYRIYEEDQVEPDPTNPGYYRLIGNVSINSGTITPYSQGFNPSNVFTVAVENSTTTSTTTTTTPISYYGAVRTIDTSANTSAWTLITVTDTSTPLIDEEFIGSLTAAKITTGTIGAAEITLNGANSIIKSSNYSTGLLGWKITGNGNAEFNELEVRTALNIGGDDIASFHVDVDGNMWSGASIANKDTAPFRVSNTGQLTASSVTITNPVVTTPAITNGSITGTSLDVGTGTSSFHVDATGRIWSGNAVFASGPFSVTATGVLTATGATITGAINATSGTINNTLAVGTSGNKINIVGTATASSTAIYSGTSSYGSGGFWLDASGRFSIGSKLTFDGTNLIINGGGTFTGALSGGTIQIGSGESVFKADGNGIYLGNETFGSAEFRVSLSGALNATSASISGTITGSTISGSSVTVGTFDGVNTGLRITSDGYIQGSGGGVRIKNWDGSTGVYLFGNSITTPALNGDNGSFTNQLEIGGLNKKEYNFYPGGDIAAEFIEYSDGTGSYLNFKRRLATAGTNPRFFNFYKLTGTTNTETEIARFNINNGDTGLTLNSCTAVPPSDKRLKSVIDGDVDFLSILKQIQPVKFKWKNDLSNTEYVGFLAQDLINIVPQAVYPGDEEGPIVNEEDNTISVKQNWGIDYGYLVTYLVGAVQELSAKVDELESRLV